MAGAALAGGLVAGMAPGGLALLALASVGAEYALSSAVTGGLLDTVEANAAVATADRERRPETGSAPPGASCDVAPGTEDALATLETVVDEVGRDLGIDPVSVAVDPTGELGVSVLGGGDRTVLLVSGPVIDRLDGEALRGVVAHELGHVARRHLRGPPVGPATGHVVGVVVLWVVALHATMPAVTTLVAAGYLSAGVSRWRGPARLWYVAGSLGLVLVPLALSAYASRLAEREADDVAVAATSATAFCTGLYLVTTAGAGASTGGVAADEPAPERGPLGRFTAAYPTMESRIERQGLDPAAVAERAAGGAAENRQLPADAD